MLQVNIHEAKTHLSRLIEGAAQGEPFVIAKAGKPLVTVSACSPSVDCARRVGFLKDRIQVPDDFDSMGHDTVQVLFTGRADAE